MKEAEQAVNNFIKAYPGLERLKKEVIPSFVRKGFFNGFDGRPVVCDSEHLMLAGMLQNGEKVVMGRACVFVESEIKRLGLEDKAQLINIVHDEMIILVDDDKELCHTIRELAERSITMQGDELKLNCPMKGDAHIGYDWLNIH